VPATSPPIRNGLEFSRAVVVCTHGTTVLAHYAYTLDTTGNRTHVTETVSDITRGISYTYDPLYRLTAADYSTGETYAYQYDPVGNREAMTVTSNQQPATSFYVYDAANRLTSIQLPDSSIQGYTWDNRGNLLADGTFTYTYSAAGRMVQAQSLTATLVYTYNADGLRVAQSQSVSSVQSVDLFTWDWATGVPELLSDGESLYLIGYDTLGWQTGTDWTFVLPDALGSVRQETDVAGAVTAAREWLPYGEELGGAQAGLGYTGEWYDTSVGLQYLRARWLDVGTGRFIQVDPSRLERHPYAYAQLNPVVMTDPTGYFSPQMIARSLGKDNFEEALDWVEHMALTQDSLPKWGLLASLLKANSSDTIMGAYLDFNGEAMLVRMGQVFSFGNCNIEVATPTEGILSLKEFFEYTDTVGNRRYNARLSRYYDNMVEIPLHRSSISRYQLLGSGEGFRDTNLTDLPDFIGYEFSVDVGGDVVFGKLAWLFDRYGNDYGSVGGGIGLGVSLPVEFAHYEGYVTRGSDLFRPTPSILSESELTEAIVGLDEGIEFGVGPFVVGVDADKGYVDPYVTLTVGSYALGLLSVQISDSLTFPLPIDVPRSKGWVRLDNEFYPYYRSSVLQLSRTPN